eukprot:3906921-Lingulodinium_polyedra.AAC.1
MDMTNDNRQRCLANSWTHHPQGTPYRGPGFFRAQRPLTPRAAVSHKCMPGPRQVPGVVAEAHFGQPIARLHQ